MLPFEPPFRVYRCVLQIDKDRAVAAGASYGGYAIKYILAVDLLRPRLKTFLVGFRATPSLALDSRLSFATMGYAVTAAKLPTAETWLLH